MHRSVALSTGAVLLGAVFGLTCTRTPDDNTTPWAPGTVYETPREANARGLLDRRGLIHAHSVYSHDACDNQPVKDGVRDPECREDFRRDLCTAKHDFVMLTDHRDAFSDTDFPDVLLFEDDRGDALVERAGRPVASWMSCGNDRSALIMAGAESGTMPVGLEEHVADRSERSSIYGSKSPEAIEALKEKGAVVLVAHTEGWTVDELSDLPLDGFEMYNLHANTFSSADVVLTLMARVLGKEFEGLPHPDLIFVMLFRSNDENYRHHYLGKWASVLARGHRRVTTLGTDCHRNSFGQLMQDGERGDSYRRMMIWFSNHLLVRPESDGSWDDRHLKQALRDGRLYGAFEILGHPDGFDYHATGGEETFEMGDEVLLSSSPELRMTMPTMRNLDRNRQAPALTARILKAVEGDWEEMATGSGDLSFQPTEPGAYRAEVRMVPHHLAEDLGDYTEELLARDYVWIYSNPIYVR